jgi:hypothetical protein
MLPKPIMDMIKNGVVVLAAQVKEYEYQGLKHGYMILCVFSFGYPTTYSI